MTRRERAEEITAAWRDYAGFHLWLSKRMPLSFSPRENEERTFWLLVYVDLVAYFEDARWENV